MQTRLNHRQSVIRRVPSAPTGRRSGSKRGLIHVRDNSSTRRSRSAPPPADSQPSSAGLRCRSAPQAAGAARTTPGLPPPRIVAFRSFAVAMTTCLVLIVLERRMRIRCQAEGRPYGAVRCWAHACGGLIERTHVRQARRRAATSDTVCRLLHAIAAVSATVDGPAAHGAIACRTSDCVGRTSQQVNRSLLRWRQRRHVPAVLRCWRLLSVSQLALPR